MKRFVLALLFYFLALNCSYASTKMSEKNTEKEEWYLTIGSKLEGYIRKKIEGTINQIFQEPLYKIIGDSIRHAFGKKFSDSLSGFISVGPFLKMDSLIGSLGRSESQIMTRVILDAINEAKEEIINAVEQQFRDETSARLDALVNNLAVYNSRPEADRQLLFFQLGDMINEASYIRSRIQIKNNYYLEDIHPYMTVVSMQIMMEKEFTRWVSINVNPSITEEEIEDAAKSIVFNHVNGAVQFITSSYIGVIDSWQQRFNTEFSDVTRYVRPVSLLDIQGTNYARIGSGYHSYLMSGKEVEFAILRRKDGCIYDYQDDHFTTRRYDVRDASGAFIVTIRHTSNERPADYHLPSDQIVCDFAPVSEQYVLENGPFWGGINLRYYARQAIARHRSNQEAFNAYMIDGYLPVKKMLDGWWEYAGEGERPKSEIDVHMESVVELRPDISVSYNREQVLNASSIRYFFDISNVGGSSAYGVKVNLSYGGNVRTDGLHLDDGTVITSPWCFNDNICNLGTIDEGGVHTLAVTVVRRAGMDVELVVQAVGDEVEISSRNNRQTILVERR